MKFDTLYEKAVSLAKDHGIRPYNGTFVKGQNGIVYRNRPQEDNTFEGDQHFGKSSLPNYERQNNRVGQLRANPNKEPEIITEKIQTRSKRQKK